MSKKNIMSQAPGWMDPNIACSCRKHTIIMATVDVFLIIITSIAICTNLYLDGFGRFFSNFINWLLVFTATFASTNFLKAMTRRIHFCR